MQTTKYIFIIKTEQHYQVLTRIIATFNRQRMLMTEFNAQQRPGDDTLLVMLSVEDTKSNVEKISRRIDREVDVISVQIFEQLN